MSSGSLAERLTYILELRKLSARQLSLMAGLNKGHISTILNNEERQHLRSDIAYRIAYAAKVSLSWLAEGVGEPDDDDIPRSSKKVQP